MRLAIGLLVGIRPQADIAPRQRGKIGVFHGLAATRPGHHHQLVARDPGRLVARLGGIAGLLALSNDHLGQRMLGQLVQTVQRARLGE
ncbi:hypothetical protein D3C76_1079460 [compost metagenome]